MKYANYLIFIFLVSMILYFKNNINISSNLISTFATEDTINKFKIANELGLSKDMYIVVKGFNHISKNNLHEIKRKLSKVKNIEFIKDTILPSDNLKEFYKKFYTLLASFDNSYKTDEMIYNTLKNIYNEQHTNIFYKPIDRYDPLMLFKLDNINNDLNTPLKGNYMVMGEYGYMLKVKTSISPSQMKEAKELYNNVHNILKNYDGTLSFAPFYYTVENSNAIQQDVKIIILISMIILFLIYFLFLGNIQLLFHVVIAFISSILFAMLILIIIVDEINILSLAFGISLTAVSIDYLFHYYFHNFYNNKSRIQKSVLYGFLTTISSFFILSYISIELISQVSLFAVLSISFSYILFTFIFPYLEIKIFDNNSFKDSKQIKFISPNLIFIISIILSIYVFLNIKFDQNIKNLDYKNEKLIEREKKFKSLLMNDYSAVIVKAKSKNELLENLFLLKKLDINSFSLASFLIEKNECQERYEKLINYDFQRINKLVNEYANIIGFKENLFKNSYNFASEFPSCDFKSLLPFREYGLEIYYDKSYVYTLAFISDKSITNDIDFITLLNYQKIFETQTSLIYSDIWKFFILVVSIILLSLFFFTKRYLYALNFILFPMIITLAILVNFMNINVMHIFAFIILLAICIDFGIYMSNTNNSSTTELAIRYSLLSTFAGFGVLVLSSINALSSIGLVITLGVITIYFLIKVMK